MSKMVSARVPDALYEQVSARLAEMGASPSELVKAAFEYVLRERALPGGDQHAHPKGARMLSREKAECLRRSLAACTLELDIPRDVAWDKQVIAEARGARYEALA